MKKLSRLLGRAYDEALADCKINITQLAVMRCIGRRAGEPLARVAEELEMDRTSLYRAIRPMLRDGWIRTAPGDDARTLSATITRKGGNVLAGAGGRWDALQNGLMNAFGKDSWSRLVGEIQRLAECAETVRTSEKIL